MENESLTIWDALPRGNQEWGEISLPIFRGPICLHLYHLYHRFDIGSIWIHGQLTFMCPLICRALGNIHGVLNQNPGWGEARSCGENNHKPSPSHHQFMAGLSHQKWVYIKLLYHFCFTHMFESPVRRTAGKMSQSCWGPDKNNCSRPFLDRKVALKTGRSSRLLQQTLSSKDLLDSYLSWMVGRKNSKISCKWMGTGVTTWLTDGHLQIKATLRVWYGLIVWWRVKSQWILGTNPSFDSLNSYFLLLQPICSDWNRDFYRLNHHVYCSHSQIWLLKSSSLGRHWHRFSGFSHRSCRNAAFNRPADGFTLESLAVTGRKEELRSGWWFQILGHTYIHT